MCKFRVLHDVTWGYRGGRGSFVGGGDDASFRERKNVQWRSGTPRVTGWEGLTEVGICRPTPFYSYPPEVRKIIYTTNAIESLHMQLRKVLKNRGHFPSDEAATKLIYLALRNITKSWTNPPLTWRMAANQFAIQFGQRFNK